MGKKESQFQRSLIEKIEERLPGCMILKNDPTYIQGIPDLLVLHNEKWAALECKRNSDAASRPNQEHFINKMNQMSYASFVYPENEKEVLDAIQSALQP